MAEKLVRTVYVAMIPEWGGTFSSYPTPRRIFSNKEAALVWAKSQDKRGHVEALPFEDDDEVIQTES